MNSGKSRERELQVTPTLWKRLEWRQKEKRQTAGDKQRWKVAAQQRWRVATCVSLNSQRPVYKCSQCAPSGFERGRGNCFKCSLDSCNYKIQQVVLDKERKPTALWPPFLNGPPLSCWPEKTKHCWQCQRSTSARFSLAAFLPGNWCCNSLQKHPTSVTTWIAQLIPAM